VQNQDPEAKVSLNSWQVINTTTWRASDNLTIKNIASYGELTNILRSELFGTNFYFPPPNGTIPLSFVNSRPPPGFTSSDQATMSEELQFQGVAFDGRLDWQSGVYVERSKPVEKSGSLSPQTISCTDSDSFQCFDVLGAAAGREGFVGSLNNPFGSIEYNNLGVYAQGTYDFTDRLTGTLGVRYTRDETEAEARLVVWRFPEANQPSPRCNTNLFVEVSDVSECNRQFKTDSSAPTWVLGLDYKPIEDLLVYGKYSRGYRQGSVSPFSGAVGFEEFDPEEVDTFELGLKTSFDAVVSGTFNAAVFYTDFTDQQILVGFSNTQGTIAPTATPVNAGSSRMYGLEIESQLRPFKDLTIDLSYAFLDTKLEELRDITLPENSPFDTVQLPTQPGDDLTFSPENKGTVAVSYLLPLPTSIGSVYTGINYTYVGSQLQSKSSPFGVIPSYELVNANLGWTSVYGGPVDLSLFATNLLDEEYYTSITGIWQSGGFEGRYAAPPRMVGARVRVNFGT
jgi:iron complex outermembrane recepter protein